MLKRNITLFALSVVSSNALSSGYISEGFASNIISEDTSSVSPWFSTTLNRSAIKASGASSIPDALRLIPGFVSVAPFGSYQNAFYRGMSDEYSRRMLIEVNNVPINLSSTGSVFWSSLPFNVDDIDRITFIANPSSSTNGDQAFNGVLKIYTVEADELANSISATIGTKSYKRVSARISEQLGNDTYVQFSASKLVSDGVFDKVSTEDNTKFWVSLTHKQDSDNKITAVWGIGNSIDDENSDDALRYIPIYENRGMRNTQGSFNWVNTKDGVFSLTAGYSLVDNEMANLLDNGFLFDISYESLRTYLSADYKKSLGTNASYYFGLNVKKDSETPYTWSKDETLWESTIYNAKVGGSYRFSDFTVSSGVGFQAHSEFDSSTTAHLTLLKELTPSSNVSMNYSQGIRYPVNWESKSQHYIVNPVNGLVVTRNDSIIDEVGSERVESLSFKYQFNHGYKRSFSARLFMDRYDDLIYSYFKTAPLGSIGLYGGKVLTNGYGDSMTVKGFEAHSKWPITKSVNSIFSYSRTVISTDEDNAANRDDSIPSSILTAGLNFRIGQANINTYLSHVSSVTWDSQVEANPAVVNTGYNTASINISRCYKTGGLDRLCLTAAANNILENGSTFYNEEEGSITDTQLFLKADYQF